MIAALPHTIIDMDRPNVHDLNGGIQISELTL